MTNYLTYKLVQTGKLTHITTDKQKDTIGRQSDNDYPTEEEVATEKTGRQRATEKQKPALIDQQKLH